MVNMPRPTDADREWFLSLVPHDERVTVKPMFGNLGAFVNGNMFMGLFGRDVGVRLADDERAVLEGIEGTGPFGPAGRPMRGYVALPQDWRSDRAEAAPWVGKALAHGGEMPPKRPEG
jgi:TfoX/Sxy family transcriptional regulator of competence genes